MLLQIEKGGLIVSFSKDSACLPSSVVVRENDGRKTLLFPEKSWNLSLKLASGKVLRPVPGLENIDHYEEGDCTCVDFLNVHFQDGDGKLYEEYNLTLRHEFYADGTAFSNMFFFVRDVNSEGIVSFDLSAAPDFSSFDSLRWSCRERPMTVDGTMITAQTERFLPPGQNRIFAQALPLVSFNAARKFAPSCYVELFVEGQSTLSNRPEDSETSLEWKGLNPGLNWNFQKGAFPKPLIHQLRNQWGWVIRPSQGKRHLPPMRMYHYFDNYLRYPTNEIIRAVAESGCDVFIMHENWRTDTQNDGVPFDPERFILLRDALHAAGIRLAVYIRGNEESVIMRQARWFRRLLTYNFDGLYMDYGGPFNRNAKADEQYCGGRILFREHYMVMRRLRETIGPDGILYSHTGPSFSAVSMSFMTGYVSGEGERGMLIRGREEHEYFSMAPVCPGTLWSAAFPEYASKRILPFIAAAGQYPHSNLGEQFLSSSLVHPGVPGINDREFVPLWKLWSIVRREKDLLIFHDSNSTGVFPRDALAGHYLFISEKKNFALLVLSNFDEEKPERNISADVCWEKTPLNKENCSITLLQNGKATLLSRLPEAVTLESNGVCGLLLTAPEIPSSVLLDEYCRKEAELAPLGKNYLARVEEQKRLRKAPPWEKTYLRINMPDLSPTPYEDSMTVDLFDNAFQIGVMENGTFRSCCYLDKEGVSPVLRREKNPFSSDITPVICLNDLGLKGLQKMAVYTTHADSSEPFYIFCYVELSPTPEFDKEVRRLEFLNDIEPDRACLNFECAF